MNWYTSLKDDLEGSSIYSKVKTLLFSVAETQPGKAFKLYLLLQEMRSILLEKDQDSDRLFGIFDVIKTELNSIQPLTEEEKQELNQILNKNALPDFF